MNNVFPGASVFSAKTIVTEMLKDYSYQPIQSKGEAFAPTNIALCKYWGKRDAHLNLPVTGSLSISLGTYGTRTQVAEWEGAEDSIQVNQMNQTAIRSDNTPATTMDVSLPPNFKARLLQFLDLIRPQAQTRYRIETESDIPIAAGLASSASGFAALVLAIDQLYGWNLPLEQLSVLARLGSGSACRSLWSGFVEWLPGQARDGRDSHGQPIHQPWAALRLGLLIINDQQKSVSSRAAMQITQETSPFYKAWPGKVNQDLQTVKKAIEVQDFVLLGETVESNAQAMHALMMTANPSIVYTLPETLKEMQRVWACRRAGLPVYFTQDAGPNLKLLFLEDHVDEIVQQFPGLQVVTPFLEGEK